MAATLITISKIGDPTNSLEIKVNDGHPVPLTIIADSVLSFRTWLIDDSHIFVWVTDSGQEKSMKVPAVSIGWVVSSRPVGSEGDKFRIEAPCTVDIVVEV